MATHLLFLRDSPQIEHRRACSNDTGIIAGRHDQSSPGAAPGGLEQRANDLAIQQDRMKHPTLCRVAVLHEFLSAPDAATCKTRYPARPDNKQAQRLHCERGYSATDYSTTPAKSQPPKNWWKWESYGRRMVGQVVGMEASAGADRHG